ncbi:MAG TPA: response regulator, partial [Spirochaetota bacterium]|nr:response regulator [Spirochaetota bacterium]
VITDLTVPGGMGGREAISILRNAVPSIKAIVSSGFSCDPVLADCTAWGFVAALVKPYTFSQLVQILASVLNQPS